jgi:hypothetical protein
MYPRMSGTRWLLLLPLACVLLLPQLGTHVDGRGKDAAPDLPVTAPVDKELQRAFGTDCEEVSWGIKCCDHGTGLILATKAITILDDGRASLSPCSIARFSKREGAAELTPVAIIRSSHAYLYFSQPMRSWQDLGKLQNLRSAEFAEGFRLVVEPTPKTSKAK